MSHKSTSLLVALALAAVTATGAVAQSAPAGKQAPARTTKPARKPAKAPAQSSARPTQPGAAAKGTAIRHDAPWPAMAAYHKVMAATFHPAEEGNLAPIRERAGELASRGYEWAASSVPAGMGDAAQLKAKITALARNSEAVSNLVKAQADDQQLQAAMTTLHDEFHDIVGMCHH